MEEETTRNLSTSNQAPILQTPVVVGIVGLRVNGRWIPRNRHLPLHHKRCVTQDETHFAHQQSHVKLGCALLASRYHRKKPVYKPEGDLKKGEHTEQNKRPDQREIQGRILYRTKQASRPKGDPRKEHTDRSIQLDQREIQGIEYAQKETSVQTRGRSRERNVYRKKKFSGQREHLMTSRN